MNVRHTLICFFFLTLRDGNSGLTNTQNFVHTRTEGDNIKVGCSFPFPGGRKVFCKGKCEEGNILVETTRDSAQRGRYSIRYVAGTFPAREKVLYVSITKLTKSDAGWYQCGLKVRPFPFSDSYQDFEIRVTDAPTSLTSAPSASSLSSVLHQPPLNAPRILNRDQQLQLVTKLLMKLSMSTSQRECEEVREEDRGSRSPPVEMSVLSTSHCRHFSEDN
ncbi:hypothetical protein NQZ68_035895 [Dissostichus eleginoides]|nr:hypothetical protein NQZ68_035895 [Dissostichus eleginoides]